MQFVLADVEGGTEEPHQLPGEMLRQDLGGDIALAQCREEQGKFVTRGAGEHQVLLGQGLESHHHGLEQQVAAGVAEGVVDRLEVVQIQQQQGPPLTARGLQGALHDVVQAAPVVEIAQVVVIGEALDVTGRLLLLGDVVKAADEVAELLCLIPDTAHHEPYREETTLLVQALLLTQPVSLAVDGGDHVLFQAVAIVGGSQGFDVLADHLLAREAGDAAEGSVDLEDDATVIHHQQAIVGIEGHLGQAQGVIVDKAP